MLIDKIDVICEECLEYDPDKEAKMIGSDDMFENKEAMTQARQYHCPLCHNRVTVIIKFKQE